VVIRKRVDLVSRPVRDRLRYERIEFDVDESIRELVELPEAAHERKPKEA
jgi:hypothetical protein